MRAKFAGKMLTFAIAALSGSEKPHRSWRSVHTDAGVFERLASLERFRNCDSWASRPTSVPSKRMSEIGWVSPENLDWRAACASFESWTACTKRCVSSTWEVGTERDTALRGRGWRRKTARV